MKKRCNILLVVFAYSMTLFSEIQKLPHADQNIRFDLDKLCEVQPIYPGIVIGSGVAGCTAAYYFARSKLPTYIIRGPQPGGQLTGAGLVENMPALPITSGFDITVHLQKQAESFGVQMIDDNVMELDLSTWPFVVKLESGKILYALTVIIATGSAPRKLGIPGELVYWGSGVSSCAVCDCFVFKDLEVAIVGGGDSAAEQALILAPYAKKITIFVRKDQMRAVPTLQERLKDYEYITIIYHKEVIEVKGNGQVVIGLIIKDTLTHEITYFPCDGLFLAIGHNPNSSLVANYLDLSDDGYVHLASRSQETNIRGVFAAGDVADNRFRQAATAAGTGTQAALEALDFLREIGITERTIKRYIK